MLSDVVRGDVCQGKHCVWPIRNQQNETLILVQVTHGSNKKFIQSRDSRLIDGMCKVIAQVYENLCTQDRVTQSQSRAVTILNTFKHLLAERSHMNILKKVVKVFPALFRFEECMLLFVNSKENELFKVQYHELTEQEKKAKQKEFDNICTFPLHLGCTGQAIETQKSVYFNASEEKSLMFESDIDYCIGGAGVESLSVSPIFSSDGELQGVLQLVNRLNSEKISTQDCLEVESLMPALGQII